MTKDDDEIDVLVTNRLLEPVLFDGIFDRVHYGIVCIARKVEDESKCQNANSLVLGCELPESLRKRLHFACLRVVDVQVGSNVVAFVIRNCLVEFVVRGIRLVELVVP